jgi:hypothetical protein
MSSAIVPDRRSRQPFDTLGRPRETTLDALDAFAIYLSPLSVRKPRFSLVPTSVVESAIYRYKGASASCRLLPKKPCFTTLQLQAGADHTAVPDVQSPLSNI